MGLGRVSEYAEGATWQPCEQQPPGTITLRTPVENFQILFFFFFFLNYFATHNELQAE